MKKNLWLIFAIFLLSVFFNAAAQGEKIALKELPEKYRIWLEEVDYIIIHTERDVFLRLTTDRERDLFIEAFWKHRDPVPETVENEYKIEHYRRLSYVNRVYAAAGKPGWKTDRGRIYVLLGEPKEVRVFQGSDSYYPSEVWYYQGIKNPNLPPAFYLLFFQKSRIGDYVLYDPVTDGPWSLFAGHDLEGNLVGNYEEAYAKLENIEPHLASVSLSLIPGESASNIPSLASSLLLSTIEDAGRENVKDLYANKFLAYKEFIETDYSTNFIESEYQVYINRARSGVHFVHFSIELQQINMINHGGIITADLQLNCIVIDESRNPIYQFEEIITLRLKEDQFKMIRQRPLCIAEAFPLIPGNFRIMVLLKNTVSKEFCSFEKELTIPSIIDKPLIGPMLLAFNAVQTSSINGENRPFVFCHHILYSQSNRVFLRNDKFYVFFQIEGLLLQDLKKSYVTFNFFKEGKEVLFMKFPIVKYDLVPNMPIANVFETFSLDGLESGYYTVYVSLLNEEGNEIANNKEQFVISPLAYLPRPWVHSKSIVDSGESQTSFIIGQQSMNSEKIEEALSWLEKALT